MHKKRPLVVIGLQQSLGRGRSSIHYFFFFSREMTRSFTKGLVILRLSLSGEMSFTKVCVPAPYELFIVYCLLSFYHTNKHMRIKFNRRLGKGAQGSQ